MKILVTGGAGFIGSHLLKLLAVQQNVSVVVVDNLSVGKRQNVPDKFELICCDIRDNNIETVFDRHNFDVVIHLAAQTMVPYSLLHPAVDCDVNLIGLINILECCRKYKVKNVVFSSSAAVYGNNTNIPLQENEILLPTSFYGLTKMASEHYLRIYHNLYKINATVLRFANVYGERQGEGGEGGVISIFCKNLVQRKPINVFGDGTQTRDFVYAGDIAKALWKSVDINGFNIINISTKKETALNDLVKAFHNAVGYDFEVQYLAPREGDIYRSVLDNDNCKKILSFTPETELMNGIQRTYLDYLKTVKEVK